jgi:hypothetical protein
MRPYDDLVLRRPVVSPGGTVGHCAGKGDLNPGRVDRIGTRRFVDRVIGFAYSRHRVIIQDGRLGTRNALRPKW